MIKQLLAAIKHKFNRKEKNARGTIFLHIGLPKSASTFLQGKIFPNLPLQYWHKTKDEKSFALIKALRSYYHRDRFDITKLLRSLPEKLIHELRVGNSVLISDENLSITSMDLWNKSGYTPDHFFRLTLNLAKKLNIKITVIYISRSLDTWIASRYAQSAPKFDNPGQEDFEERLRAISENPSAYPALAWLNPSKVKDAFETEQSNIALRYTSQEEFLLHPENSLNKIMPNSFLITRTSFHEDDKFWAPENKRSKGSVWICRDREHEIMLTEKAKQYISVIENFINK